MSLDVDGASIFEVCRTIRCWDGHIYTSAIFQTDMRDKSDEATKTTRTREGLLEAHQSGSLLIQEYESPCQGLHSSAPFSTHFSVLVALKHPDVECSQFVLPLTADASYILSDACAVVSKTSLALVSTVLIVRWSTSTFAPIVRLPACLEILTHPAAGIVLPISC